MHNTDNILLEVMLELAEEENKDLRDENELLYGYIQYLRNKNNDLVKQYNDLVRLENRFN
jgi:hypothetical protein